MIEAGRAAARTLLEQADSDLRNPPLLDVPASEPVEPGAVAPAAG